MGLRNGTVKIITVAAALWLTACGGKPETTADLTIEPGFIRTPSVGAPATAGYLTITSPADDVLVGVRMADVGAVELHTMMISGDVMKMRKIDQLVLPAGTPVALAPGGNHLMIMQPGDSLVDGETAEITLILENAGDVTVSLPVSRAAPHHHE